MQQDGRLYSPVGSAIIKPCRKEFEDEQNMTQPIDLNAKRRQQQLDNSFEWIPEFIETKKDEDPEYIRFTPEGKAYYEKWLKKYGYSLQEMSSASRFIKVVRQILRQRVEEAPPSNLNDPVIKAIDEALQKGDGETIIKIAEELKASNPGTVTEIKRD